MALPPPRPDDPQPAPEESSSWLRWLKTPPGIAVMVTIVAIVLGIVIPIATQGGTECVSFAGANENFFNWDDVPSGVYVGDSPIGDRSKMYAIRIGDAVWLTDAPPDGAGDAALTLPVNGAARSYDPFQGADVNVADSAWAELAAGAEAASAACS